MVPDILVQDRAALNKVTPPLQGYYQQAPPVVLPLQYNQQQPSNSSTSKGFLQGCLVALCCCCEVSKDIYRRNKDVAISIQDVLYCSTHCDQISEPDETMYLDRVDMNWEDSDSHTEMGGAKIDSSHSHASTSEMDAMDSEDKNVGVVLARDTVMGRASDLEDDNRVYQDETQLISSIDTSHLSAQDIESNAKMGCHSKRDASGVPIPCKETVAGEHMVVDQCSVPIPREPPILDGNMKVIDNALAAEENSAVRDDDAHEISFKIYVNPGYDDCNSVRENQDDTRPHTNILEGLADQKRSSVKSEELKKKVIVKERLFMKGLQERALQRAAAETESSSRFKKEPEDGEQEESSITRPVIWGTSRYKELWTKATHIDNSNRNANSMGEEDVFDSVAGADDISEKIIQAVVSTPI